MSSQLISEYIGRGLLANRPVSPAVASGVGAFYFSTDTSVLSVWNGTAWNDIIPSGALTVVQHAFSAQNNLSTGLSFASPPQPGNLLIAICGRNALSAPIVDSSWLNLQSQSGTNTSHLSARRTAGVGEPALQTPTSSNFNGVIAMWEIAGLRSINSVSSAVATGVTNTATEANVRAVSGFILGAAWSTNGFDDIPTIGGNASSLLTGSVAGTVGGSSWQITPNTINVTSLSSTATYPTSRSNRQAYVFVT